MVGKKQWPVKSVFRQIITISYLQLTAYCFLPTVNLLSSPWQRIPFRFKNPFLCWQGGLPAKEGV